MRHPLMVHFVAAQVDQCYNLVVVTTLSGATASHTRNSRTDGGLVCSGGCACRKSLNSAASWARSRQQKSAKCFRFPVIFGIGSETSSIIGYRLRPPHSPRFVTKTSLTVAASV